jgi:hypothetical protein
MQHVSRGGNSRCRWLFQPHIVTSVIKKEVRSKKVIMKKKFHLIPILYGDFPLKETRSSVRPVKGDTR